MLKKTFQVPCQISCALPIYQVGYLCCITVIVSMNLSLFVHRLTVGTLRPESQHWSDYAARTEGHAKIMNCSVSISWGVCVCVCVCVCECVCVCVCVCVCACVCVSGDNNSKTGLWFCRCLRRTCAASQWRVTGPTWQPAAHITDHSPVGHVIHTHSRQKKNMNKTM